MCWVHWSQEDHRPETGWRFLNDPNKIIAQGTNWRFLNELKRELKVAGPSMLGIGCPDRHALPRITLSKMRRPRRALPPARAGSFFGASRPLPCVPARVPLLNR